MLINKWWDIEIQLSLYIYVHFMNCVKRMHGRALRVYLVAVLLRTVWNYCILCFCMHCVIHPCHHTCPWHADSMYGCCFLKHRFTMKQRIFCWKYYLGFRLVYFIFSKIWDSFKLQYFLGTCGTSVRKQIFLFTNPYCKKFV